LIIGGIVSLNDNVKEHEELFPAASVAVNNITVSEFIIEPIIGNWVIVGVGSQLSDEIAKLV